MSVVIDEPQEQVAFPKKNFADGEMDITPMIDIVFLLLIFFVVTSKMTAEQAPKVPPARHGVAVNIQNNIALVLSRGGGETARVRAEGTGGADRNFSDDPEQQTAEVIEYITAELEKGKSDVLLRAEGDVKNGEIKRIRDALSEVLEDGQMINISVTHES